MEYPGTLCSSICNQQTLVQCFILRNRDLYTDLIIEKIILRNSQGEGTTTVLSGEELRVEVYYKALKRLPKPCFWIAVRSRFGSLFGANMLFDAARPDYIEGRGMIACIFSDTRLLPQTYTIRLVYDIKMGSITI